MTSDHGHNKGEQAGAEPAGGPPTIDKIYSSLGILFGILFTTLLANMHEYKDSPAALTQYAGMIYASAVGFLGSGSLLFSNMRFSYFPNFVKTAIFLFGSAAVFFSLLAINSYFADLIAVLGAKQLPVGGVVDSIWNSFFGG